MSEFSTTRKRDLLPMLAVPRMATVLQRLIGKEATTSAMMAHEYTNIFEDPISTEKVRGLVPTTSFINISTTIVKGNTLIKK
jgi:hypothetical protein